MPFKKRQPEPAPEPKTAEEKVAMFAIRNAISEAQDEIVSYNWVDPETGRKVGGGTLYLVLSKMAKHCWAPAAVSCLGYKTIARSADCNKGWVPVALRAAEASGGKAIQNSGDVGSLLHNPS